MLSVYPYGTGSAYTASYAITSSHAIKTNIIVYTLSASVAPVVLFPESGSRGKSVCLLTKAQYEEMVATGKMEICTFSTPN